MLRGTRPGVSGGASRHLVLRLSGRGGQELRPAPAAGVFQPRVLRGRALSSSATASRSLAAVHGQVGALGEVLAQQPVGVLVAAALPGRVRVAEVDLQVRGHGELRRGWPSPCPGPRSATGAARRAASRSSRSSRAATASAPCPAGQVQQHHEPGGALHQRADRRLAGPRPTIRSPSQCPGTARSSASAGRSLMITMPGDLPAPLAVLAPRPAQRPPGPQARRQLPAQRPAALHVERLVDRLVRHPHLRIVRELPPQPSRDLLRRPVLLQPGLHPAPAAPSFPASFAVFGRARPRPRACACAATARYRPPAPGCSARTSRLTVDGARPSRAAIARSDSPAASPTAISSRSATDRYRPLARPRPVRLHPARLPEPRQRRHRADPRRRPRLLHPQPRPDPIPELHLHRPRRRRTPTSPQQPPMIRTVATTT